MENFALIALAESLKPAMEGLIIRRVIQHQPNGFILQTRSQKLPALKLLMNAQNPAIYPSEAKPPQQESANSDFLMVLRKHFTSAELIEFRKPLSERVLEFVFKTAVPSKELERMSLVVELIPNAPNIILLDASRRVLASFRELTPQHEAGEFDPYSPPQRQSSTMLESIVAGEVADLEAFDDSRKWLIAHIAGVGPVFADEIVFRRRKTGRTLSEEIRDLIVQAEMSHSARLYTEKPLGHILEQNDLVALTRAILSPVELLSLERSHSSREFTGIAEATRFFFDELESRLLLEHAKQPLLRDLRTAAKRISEKQKRLERDQAGYEEAEKLQKTGQMLASSGKSPDQRYDAITVTDYFGEQPQEARVELDPSLTLRENIERMFKRHQKAGRGKQIGAKRLAESRSRQTAVAEQIRRLQAIRDWDTWLAVAERIAVEQSGPTPPAGPERTAQSARRHRNLLVDGMEILVGRTSRENDELTFHVATPDDFWMHVADYSGSHVVVRNPARLKVLPESVLTKAAQLAAFFSQARNSPKVEVHYTLRKHVSKPRRAKPGLVKLAEFKSIRVEPRNWLETE